ncbi:MAG: DUF6544 family protein [Actinomycetota bacterium]
MNVVLIILVIVEIILLAAVYLIFLFNRKIRKEIRLVLEDSGYGEGKTFRESDLEGLPPPVSRYLSYALKDGQMHVGRAKVMQSGYIRMAENKGWLPLKAVQYFNCSKPAFIWVANVRILPGVWITVKDAYCCREGTMAARLFSSIPVTSAAGNEMDVSSLTRYLAGMVWFPTSFLPSRYLSWEPVDNGSAKAVVDDGKNKAGAVFDMDKQGRVTEVYSDERYRKKRDGYYMEGWRGYLKNYRQFGAMNIPSEIEAEWESAAGRFKYVKIRVDNIEFD